MGIEGGILEKLGERAITAEELAEEAEKKPKLLPEIFEGVSSANPQIKYGCAKTLRIVSQDSPKILYPKWDFFVEMLESGNTFLKSIAVQIIANLTRVDSKSRFEKLFNKFYRLLDDKSMVTTSNLVRMSGVIAKAKPELQSKITDKLLSIGKSRHGSECKNVIKGHIILALSKYFGESKDKKKILEFMKKELKNTRPATRKKAEKFLAKHS